MMSDEKATIRVKTNGGELEIEVPLGRAIEIATGMLGLAGVAPEMTVAPVKKISEPLATTTRGSSKNEGSQAGTLARGMAEMYVENVYRELAPKAATGLEIAAIVKDNNGLDMASTTLYRAMRKLAARGVLERIGKTSAYRLAATPKLRSVT